MASTNTSPWIITCLDNRIPPSCQRSHGTLPPAAQGRVEHCTTHTQWMEVLPLILLSIRSCWKEDIGSTTAELVYGTTHRLWGNFLTAQTLYPTYTLTYLALEELCNFSPQCLHHTILRTEHKLAKIWTRAHMYSSTKMPSVNLYSLLTKVLLKSSIVHQSLSLSP